VYYKLFLNHLNFPIKYADIIDRIHSLDPVKYGKDRNFIDGSVSYLSPYISRGVISTRQVYEMLIGKNYAEEKIEKFIQELAWRDYWQLIWKHHGASINHDFRHPQKQPNRSGIPSSMVTASTGIEAIDHEVNRLYKDGYMHNHARMYVASMACNIAQCQWKLPAQWMYYHLLDADWASNALSWQWVCGTFNNRFYYANQENINTYCRTAQKNTFLDVDYSAFEALKIPKEIEAIESIQLTTPLPETDFPKLDASQPTFIYNFYNVDPTWRSDLPGNRILLLEPSVFEEYPISQKSLQFCIDLAKTNIPDIQLWVGEFKDLEAHVNGQIYFKEHPLNRYKGTEDSRDWLSLDRGEYPSFFSFWKKCKKHLKP
jgi:deoxyribodipyrimidine photo-lyase